MQLVHAIIAPLRQRPLVLFVALVVACSATTQAAVLTATPPATASPTASPSPSPTPRPPVKVRSLTPVGSAFVATGDFRGTGATQVATIEDPAHDLSLRIGVRDTLTASAPAGLWLQTGPGFLSLGRAKLAVADVDADGRDDLVALYDSGGTSARLFVFRSTGSSFVFAGPWWSGELTWSRARSIVGGRFAGDGRDTLLVTYQDDGDRMRVLSFESNGAKLAGPTTLYESGRGEFDLSRTRFAVGHFTRATGAEQLVALAQSKAHAKLALFDLGARGLTRSELYETDADYDVARAAIVAADVTGGGLDDVVSLYPGADGSATLHVFDASAGFRPLRGWTGAATLAAGAVCGGPGALVAGDWDRDGRADLAALAPTPGAIRAELLTSAGGLFAVASTSEEGLACPTWPLTGRPLGFGDATTRPLYVKTDNNPNARPHYGISKADMVYEWLVEGLTTRLAAVYQSQRPNVIGSVRSVRMTDRHVLPSLDAALVYSGGGPEELMAINYDASVGRRYVDLSPNLDWGYRVEFRHSPYNFFTTYDAVERALAKTADGDQPAIVAPWPFLPAAGGDPNAGGLHGSIAASTITVPYRALFGVRYEYDAASGTYARYEDGVREVDGANGVAIAARNVVIVQTAVHFTTAFGLDPAGNPKLEEVLTGSGKGVVFRDGMRQDVTWSRADVVDAFRFTSASGEPVLLAPGQTWVHVVPDDWSIASR